MRKSLVIITGASSGIGEASAKVFSAAGYSLGLLARNIEAMKNLNLPNAICISTNVTDFNAFKDAIIQCEELFGPVDCLINNAGYLKYGEFTELSNDDHRNTIDTNLMGVINGIESVLPNMQKRKSGTIINISSLADRHSRPNIASYAASKAAIKSLTESLRMANAKYGIRICNIAPGKIKTPMLVTANFNEQESIPAEDLAKAALWMYQQPQTICVRDLVFAPTYYES